ncbi:hypothetical protein BGX24_009247 [Mortierella sp. AD032]|nr:hypothetical protein BGX24_009247 [Mortierella sp. AD032]
MEDPVIIEIPGDNSVSSDSARSKGDDITEDNVLNLEAFSIQHNNEGSSRKGKEIDENDLDSSVREDEEIEEDREQLDEALPSPLPRYRSYFEVLDDDHLTNELLLRPVEEQRLPITLTSATKYLKCTIPVPIPPVKKSHYDIVLGVSTKNLNLDAVEVIIITIQHKIGDNSTANSEVITPQELIRLCSIGAQGDADRASAAGEEGSTSCEITTMAPDEPCFRWKLYEKLIHLGEEEPVQLVVEVKTWQGESTDYGSIKLHYTEILNESQAFYMDDPMYREHMPFIYTIDINRTGCPLLDALPEGPKRITDYIISGDVSRVLVITVAGDHQLLQLWDFVEGLVAWMQLPIANETAYDYCLSSDGSQLVCIDLGGLDGGSDKEEEKGEGEEEAPKQNSTAFYEVDIDYTRVPPGVIAGCGFLRFNVEKICPKLKGLSAKASFHNHNVVFDTKYINRDEEFVTCDGVTIEVYSTFKKWKHLRSIVMDPTRNAPKFATNVLNALRNNLRNSHLAMRDHDAHQVSTWDINQGIRLSSYTNLTNEQMENVNDCASVSLDGSLIAIPDKHQVDIFLTATWTLVANYTFRGMEHNPSTRTVQFIFSENIMVALDYQHLPFYQSNRGFILDANRVSLVEDYITEGRDTFWTVFNSMEIPLAICIGASQLSLFSLEDRTVLSPTRLKKRCCESCHSIESFQDQGFAEATAPSGLRFKAERSTTPIILHGRREDFPVLVVTVSDKNDQSIERMSIALPKSLKFLSATFVNQYSYLLISFEKLVMVWNAPTSPQDTFTLQLVLAVDHPAANWKVCPHRQVFGLSTIEEYVFYKIDLDDPISDMEGGYMRGVTQLLPIFGNSNDVVQHKIFQYIGNNINHCRTGMNYDEAFELAKVFIDYCVHKAKLEKNPLFLLPILQCLQELTDSKTPYSEATLTLLRDLAYLPARDREAIMSQHWIAHPFELRWRFWRAKPGGLDQYKDQVLNVTSVPTAHGPENSFSREIYLATFDMLWLRSDVWPGRIGLSVFYTYMVLTDVLQLIVEPLILFGKVIAPHLTVMETSQFGRILLRILCFPFVSLYFCISFIYFCLRVAIIMVMRSFSAIPFLKVECHPFELKALDNPAIAALVEYKWQLIILRLKVLH